MNEYCQGLIKTYDNIKIDDFVNQKTAKNDLNVSLKQIKTEIFAKLNDDLKENNFSNIDQINEKLNKMIDQKEIEITDQIQEQKEIINSIEATIKKYRNLMNTELKQHFSLNNIDFKPINFDLIHKNSENESYKALGEHFPNDLMINVQKRIESWRNHFQNNAEKLNQYMENWINFMTNDQDSLDSLEVINERLIERSFPKQRDTNKPRITKFLEILTGNIFDKVKQYLQQKSISKNNEEQTHMEIDLNKDQLIEIINFYDIEVQKLIEESLLQNLTWNFFKDIDIEVSAKCKYLFGTKVNANETAMIDLSDELEKKKQDYFNVIEVVIKYRDEWLKELRKSFYIEPSTISGLNDEKMNKLKIPINLSKFVEKQLITLFETFKQENAVIIQSENEIAKVVINEIVEKFTLCLDHKIKSAFYNQDQFDIIYEELVKHSMNSLKKNFDYKSNENSFLIQYENELNAKLENQKSIIYSNYSQTIDETQSLINTYRSEALIQMNTELTAEYPDNYYENKTEFDKFCNELMTRKIVLIEENMTKIKNNLNDDFYNSLLDENATFIKEQLLSIIEHYNYKENETYPVANQYSMTFDQAISLDEQSPSSLIILFGKDQNHSFCIEHSFNSEDQGSKDFLTWQNSIRFYDKVVIGQDPTKVEHTKEFDIKDLLFIKHMKNNKKRELYKDYLFEFTLDDRVKYRENDCDLSIESLIALQVLDIKSETEKRVNTNVTNAVFIVPTNYTIRQFKDFKDIGKLSGFKEDQVTIMSQISCAAIGFAEKMRLQTRSCNQNVLIISLNEYECDSAVIQINDYNINYKTFLNKNLIHYYYNNKRFAHSSFTNEKKLEHKMMSNIKRLIDDTFKLTSKQKILINFIIVSGTSPFNFNIRQYVNEKYKPKIKCNYDSLNIIMEGAEYHARSLQNNDQHTTYQIQELIKHDTIYSLKYQGKVSFFDRYKLLCNSNTTHLDHTICNIKRTIDEFPIEIKLYQDDCVIGCFIIEKPESVEFKKILHSIRIYFLKNDQKFLINSWINDKDETHKIDLVVREMKLDENVIENEKSLIKFIFEKKILY